MTPRIDHTLTIEDTSELLGHKRPETTTRTSDLGLAHNAAPETIFWRKRALERAQENVRLRGVIRCLEDANEVALDEITRLHVELNS